MPAPAATEAAIKRAISAAQAAGLTVASFSVSRDGTVNVVTAQPVDSAHDSPQIVRPKAWRKG